MIGAALPAIACAARRPVTFDAGRSTTLQKEIVSRLAGDSEIRSGVRVAGRSAVENRKEVRAYLAELFKKFGLAPRRQTYSAEGENVYAILSCRRPSAETVVLGAHYDTARNSPGANDNASGVAAVAAVAERMSRFEGPISRDIVFVFFDEEERGMRGSRAFAQMLKDENRAVHSVHTIDQMGWDQDGDRAIELEIPYEGATDLYRRAATALGMNIVIRTTAEAGSDHSAFRRLGYKAVGITEEYRNSDTTPYIHRPGDTTRTVDFEYLASTTRLLAKAMETIAASQ
jgi:Zn-dependent M28 family amino/carboxypeptidase